MKKLGYNPNRKTIEQWIKENKTKRKKEYSNAILKIEAIKNKLKD